MILKENRDVPSGSELLDETKVHSRLDSRSVPMRLIHVSRLKLPQNEYKKRLPLLAETKRVYE
jgi:hypothetical protein